MRTLDRHDRYDIDDLDRWLATHDIRIGDVVSIDFHRGARFTAHQYVKGLEGERLVNAAKDEVLTESLHYDMRTAPPNFRKNRICRHRHRLPFTLQHPVWWLRHRVHR